LQSRASWAMIIASLVIIFIGLYLPFSPLADSLGLVQLPAKYFGFLGIVIISYAVLVQLVKIKFFKSSNKINLNFK
jgi:P-type Mg2+ transporter